MFTTLLILSLTVCDHVDLMTSDKILTSHMGHLLHLQKNRSLQKSGLGGIFSKFWPGFMMNFTGLKAVSIYTSIIVICYGSSIGKFY